MKEYHFFIYIMASHSKVLYIGVTNDIFRRVLEHKSELFKGFSQKYKTKKLVYCEYTNYINQALEREKQLKRWRRDKKIALIESINPKWLDLFDEFKISPFRYAPVEMTKIKKFLSSRAKSRDLKK